MSKALVPGLIVKFLEAYDAQAKDTIWQEHSLRFQKFWSERVIAPGDDGLSDDECDSVIRILDRNGKGNTKDSEAVARIMIPQGAWRRMFGEFGSNKEIAGLIDKILKEDDHTKRASLIDALYEANKDRKNYLTGRSGNAIAAFLAAYDPMKNLSVISINDRRPLIEFLDLKVPFDWEGSTIGTQIVQSDIVLRQGLEALGMNASARTASRFCYSPDMKALWRGEHTVKRTDKSISVTVPSNTDVENLDETNEGEIRESLQIQAYLAEIGSLMGLKIWLPKSDRARILKKWTPEENCLLDELPLNYDNTTLRTIEQIDVLWLKRRSIVRAFEVEHTTSVYSGILRMADLIVACPRTLNQLL